MRVWSSLLVFLLLLDYAPPPLGAQAAQPAKLNIVIVEGEGAINNVRQRTAREPIVQVEDENRKPVAGAAVVFLLPSQGPGAVFADGSRMLTVMTDSKGQAIARGLRANQLAGKFEIRVTASYQGQTASATIAQTNAAVAAAGAAVSGKLIAILAIAGAAAAGATVAATRNGNGAATTATPTTPTGPPATTITPGTPVVGGPR